MIGISTASAAPVDMLDWATWCEREALVELAEELDAKADRLYARGDRAAMQHRIEACNRIHRLAQRIEAQAHDAWLEARDMGADL